MQNLPGVPNFFAIEKTRTLEHAGLSSRFSEIRELAGLEAQLPPPYW
jgi:hypothetical protein